MSGNLARGLQLGEFMRQLGRLPSVDELRQEFRVSRAMGYRYLALLRGDAGTSSPPGASQPAWPVPDTAREDALMQEFNFCRDKAREIIAAERGIGAPA